MIKTVTARELSEMLQEEELVLIDVREPCEYEAGHLKGALLFPLTNFDPAALPELNPAKTVFYCAGGVRSAHALHACQDAGLMFETHLAGGINSWRDAGLPTES